MINEPTNEQKAILNYNGNTVVTANPGSGKTYTVVEKIGKVLHDLPSYKGIIAISFTNKASDELKKRCKRKGINAKSSFFGTIDKFYISEIIIPFASHLTHVMPEYQVVESTETEKHYSELGMITENVTKEQGALLKEALCKGKIFLNISGEMAWYIMCNVPGVRKYINDNSEKEKINLINQIENDAQEAFKLYELVRKSNVGIAGHVSEIYMCINVANAIKRVLEESGESFSNYLLQSDGDWVMKYVDRATDLWEEVKKIAPETNSEELEQLEIRIKQLTSDLEGTISLWEDYVNSDTTIDKTQARRILAHAYIKQMENGSKKDEQDVLKKIIKLMEDNMVVESQHTGNIRLWFDAICKYKVENQETLIMDAINKLNRWISLTDSVEAHYYRFVLKFIQAINGSILAESELPKLLRELKQKSMNLYNRTVPQHWLVNEGTGLSMLYSNSRSKKNAISEEEMAKKMRLIVGRISNNYVNESHAYINYHGTEIYFNPSATKGEIDKSKINQRVKFGIGFSYDGPRAYNSSIQLMGKEDVEEVRNIETGMIIKCEVIKNVAFFTQVRLVGYSEEVGSIHIDELSNPFNRNHRPSIGSVFEVKVLNQKFDNKTQRNIWMLTMNVSGSSDEEREETAMAKALKNIKL